jgi:hypothetical protein
MPAEKPIKEVDVMTVFAAIPAAITNPASERRPLGG